MKGMHHAVVKALLSALLTLSIAACGDSEPGENNNHTDGPHGTYLLEIPSDQWVSPEGIGNIIGLYVPDFLLGVQSSGDATVQLVGALVDDATQVQQDTCRATVSFPQSELSPEGRFTAGPVDFPITITGYDVTLHDLTITGTFTPDATGWVLGSFTGVLDAREFESFFGTDATGVCERVASVGASCEACPTDNADLCLTVRAESLTADRVEGLVLTPLPTEQLDPWCDPGVPKCGPSYRLETYAAGLYNGYTLYAPLHGTTTYLIDICGEVVHTWECDSPPAHATYLLENGHLLRAGAVGNLDFSPTSAGGLVQELDWDGTVLWRYQYCDAQRCGHHDIEPMPNGNVLITAWEKKTAAEAIAAGRYPALLDIDELWPDHIIEVSPVYPDGGTIVWEWHLWDHVIQDYDPTKANYGVVADHPELFDLNGGLSVSGDPDGSADINHINAVDYNPDLDQILLSVHSYHEIVVIDHSTTTTEAATHLGGRYGRGGDLLYRWGNPRMYGAGDTEDQKLFGQHNAHWIPPGLPGAGNILLFNNGQGRLFSSVDELVPAADASGLYPLGAGTAWGPQELAWSWNAVDPTHFMSGVVSGAQRLPNGNTLICDGSGSNFFEVTPDGVEVWRFAADPNVYFRATRYAPDYPGLANLQR